MTIPQETAAADMSAAIRELACAIREPSAIKDIGDSDGANAPRPILALIGRIDALMAQPDMSVRELCGLADRRQDVSRLHHRFAARLRRVVGQFDVIPDPGYELRPTVFDAIASDLTTDALGSLLRIAEWVERVEGAHFAQADSDLI
ncbi:hypothetical protein RNI52_08800 [Labrys neptuniae]|uniref:hypothetical protein n=1 Tax=Labrys neptuniae TaxID=376174 RepID=UPI0028917B16|nr:hypothetical protein [Labrys neptuniae]MDT3377417.1 hypothetical protein [Labrys neptuniae]